MKNTLTSLLLLLIVVGVNTLAYSQSDIHILRVEFKLDTTSATTTIEEPGMYKNTSRYEVIFHLGVNKTKGVFGAEIMMGSTEGGSEYFSYVVNTDVQNVSQNVYILPRKKEIVIVAGKYALLPGQYYAQARLRYSDGTYSEWKKESVPSPRTN